MRGDELCDAEFDDLDEADEESALPSPADVSEFIIAPHHRTPASAKPKKLALCHPDRQAYSTNIPLCRSCYDKARWTGRRGWSEELKSEALEMAFGKVPRFKQKRKTAALLDAPDSKQIRTPNPRVAKHVAGVMIMKNLDGESAAKELRPDLPPVDQAILGRKLETDPRVHAEVEKQLAKRGLDEDSKQHFISLLWQYAESRNRDDEQKTLASWPQPDLGNDSSIRKAYARWFGDFEEKNGRQPNQHEVMEWTRQFMVNNLVKGKPREELNIAFTANGVWANPNKKIPENALCVTCHKKITEHTPEMLDECGPKQQGL